MQRPLALIAIVFLLNSVACAQRAPLHPAGVAAAPTATPTPIATATPVPTASVTVTTPSPAPATSPSQIPSTAAAPTATPEVVLAAPNAPPRIIAVNMTSQTVHGGDTISGTVETTSNVASVEARIATFSIGVPKVSIGRFSLNYVVPNVPFFFHGTYPMTVIARNAAGDSVQTVIPIKVE